jgi:hypothetical protein
MDRVRKWTFRLAPWAILLALAAAAGAPKRWG